MYVYCVESFAHIECYSDCLCRGGGHTGPLDVSRESGAPAGQVEETPGRASLEKLGCRTPPQLHAGGVGR